MRAIATESNWAGCTDPTAMLSFLQSRGGASERKLRLFAVACCHGTGPPVLWPGSGGRGELELLSQAIRAAEQFADGAPQVSPKDLEMAYRKADFRFEEAGLLALACHATANSSPWRAALDTVGYLDDSYWAGNKTNYGSTILCDIFGNPFRPVPFAPEWRTSTVVALAQGIYEERAFDRLPLLMDALMDARCDSDDILNHCRTPGVHVRGCWVTDLVLGKK